MSTRISIHAPRVGSDPDAVGNYDRWSIFLSTLPAWGATSMAAVKNQSPGISIHAPRVGSDR